MPVPLIVRLLVPVPLVLTTPLTVRGIAELLVHVWLFASAKGALMVIGTLALFRIPTLLP